MKYLFTIAKYESLMLVRTWKFWILAILSAILPIIFNVYFIISKRFGVEFGAAGLEGTGPYVLFYYFNIFQILIVIFLSGDFREKDSRYQVNEVMNTKSMTNLEYILGKFLGIVIPLILLTSSVVLILSLVNRLVNWSWSLDLYFKYFALLYIPALFYSTAFIIFISSLIRNTAAVFTLVMAYTIGMFLLSRDHAFTLNQLWIFTDYVGFFLPLFPSDLVDILNEAIFIKQRIFYVLLGVFFFSLTVVLFYPRLHQSKFYANLTSFGGLGCLAGALFIFYSSWIAEAERKNEKHDIITISFNKESDSNYYIRNYDLDYKFYSDGIPVLGVSKIELEAKSDLDYNEIQFSLNPGLEIRKISGGNGNNLNYSRNDIEISVKLDKPFSEGEKRQIIFEFQGDIDKRILYLNRSDIDPGVINKPNNGIMVPIATFENESSILTRDFGYLLKESLWYPQLGNPYAYMYPEKFPVQFFTGKWTFDLPEDLTAVAPVDLIGIDSTSSQGRKVFTYGTDIPIKSIPLVTGRYRMYSTDISGININLVLSEKHQVIAEFFSEVTGEIKPIVEDIFRGIEELTGLDYPYSSLSYIEIPLTFQYYAFNGLMSDESAQAGIIFVPEYNVAGSYEEKFERAKNNADRKGEKKSDADIKKDMFVDIIVNKIFKNKVRMFERVMEENLIPAPMSSFWSQRLNFVDSPYPVFEYYFDNYLQNLINEEIKFFVTNRSDPYFVIEGVEWEVMEFERDYGVPVDTLYQLIRSTSLTEIEPDLNNNNFHVLMMVKGEKINKVLREIITPEKYKRILNKFVQEYSYKDASILDFKKVCEEVSGESLDWFFDSWLFGNAFPGYKVTNLEVFKTKGGEKGVQYVVDLKIKNGENYEGFLKVSLKTKNDEITKKSRINGKQELMFGFITEDVPTEIIIDPIFSQNQSAIRERLQVPEDFEKVTAWDGIKEIITDNLEVEGIIVDDLDPGFSAFREQERKFLRPSEVREVWRIRLDDDAFGKYKVTYREKRKGSGSIPATWETEMPESGLYDVQVFLFKGKGESNSFTRNSATRYNYSVHHSGGIESVSLEWHFLPAGWNSLGSYYFEMGENAAVVLSDEADGWLYADAVRFIPLNLNPQDKRN
ncbi:M1 family aminopeptidase [candidate division KSB1 bacterium]